MQIALHTCARTHYILNLFLLQYLLNNGLSCGLVFVALLKVERLDLGGFVTQLWLEDLV